MGRERRAHASSAPEPPEQDGRTLTLTPSLSLSLSLSTGVVKHVHGHAAWATYTRRVMIHCVGRARDVLNVLCHAHMRMNGETVQLCRAGPVCVCARMRCLYNL